MSDAGAELFRIDDSRMPVRLGSALKVPSYAYENWGIPAGAYRPESEALYSSEWEGGSDKQMGYVVKAVTNAGLGNFSQILRDANAKVVSYLIRGTKERVNYLEPGAGVSTVNLVDRLIADNVDLGRVFMTLIEPSEKRLGLAVEDLEKRGLRRGANFVAYPGRKDTDALVLVGPETQDIVSQVATLHHHAYLDVPMLTLAMTMKPGADLVSADWHNSKWEHPARVYGYISKEFEWKTKEEDLAAFCRMYPKAKERLPELRGPEETANAMIRRFWGKEGWEKVRREAIASGGFLPCDDILMLEGHRPVRRYEEAGGRAGLYTHLGGSRLIEEGVMASNPQALVDGSSILNLLVMRKPHIR